MGYGVLTTQCTSKDKMFTLLPHYFATTAEAQGIKSLSQII